MKGIAAVNTVAGVLECQESLDVYKSMHILSFVYVHEHTRTWIYVSSRKRYVLVI